MSSVTSLPSEQVDVDETTESDEVLPDYEIDPGVSRGHADSFRRHRSPMQILIGAFVLRTLEERLVYSISRNERSKGKLINSRFANHRIFPYNFP